MRLIIIVHVQFVSRVALLDDLKTEANRRPIFRNAVVWMLQIVVEELGVVKLPQDELVEHVWSIRMLLSENLL